jgi:hypothetical protein
MRIAVVLALLFFQAVVFAGQPAPIRPDPKLTPGATFDVTLQDISEPGYSKKVSANFQSHWFCKGSFGFRLDKQKKGTAYSQSRAPALGR